MIQGVRFGLALFRLGAALLLLCLLAIALDLQIEAAQATGAALHKPLPPFQATATQIPLLGINVQLEQYDREGRRSALARLQKHGFGWVRQRFDWGQLEPESGKFAWQLSDAILDDITTSGLIPVIVLDGSPAWSRAAKDRAPTENRFAPPADPTKFAQFTKAFANRYGDKLQFYQIWDEPNIAPHWGNRHIEPVAYAQLLAQSSTALRHTDPDAVIILAALAPTTDRGHMAIDEPYFLQRLYAAGAAPYFDVVAIQPFGFNNAVDDLRQQVDVLNFRRAMLIRRTMVAAGDGETPIWAVRYGWNSHPNSPWGTVIPETQRALATDALTVAGDEWPWLTAMGWAIDQPALPADDPMWGFALTNALAGVIQNWQMREPRPVIIHTQQFIVNYFLLAGLALLLLWRGWQSRRLLPWTTWLQRHRALPTIYQLLLWSFLLLIYYLATWPPLILCCWLIAAYWMVATPTAGLYLAILCLPFHFQHKELVFLNSTWTISPTQAALLCLLPALSTRLLYARQMGINLFRQIRLFDGLAFAYLLISLISASNVWHWPGYWQGMYNLVIAPLLLYIVIRVTITTQQQQRRVIYAFVLGGLLTALVGLWQWGQGMGTAADGIQRLVGSHFSPNHTALYLERALFIGLGLVLGLQGNLRRGLALISGIIAIALLLTASRGAWLLGVPLGLLYMGWHWGIRKDGSFTPSSGKGSKVLSYIKVFLNSSWNILAILSICLIFYLFWDRLTNSTTILDRFAIWTSSIQLWKAYPFVGVGPGGFFWRYPAYLSANAALDPNLRHPHNLWLEFGTTWGWLGIVWLSVFFWSSWCLIKRREQSWVQVGLIASLIAGLAHGQVDSFMLLADLAGWFWAVLGIYPALQLKIDEDRYITDVALSFSAIPFRRQLRNFLFTRRFMNRLP